MKRITLPVFPDGVIVYEFPSLGSMGKCEYCVPAGFEAAVMKDGCLSDLYREGDRICLNVKKGLFGIKRKDIKDTHLYICKKQVNKPLKWGVGDIPYYAEPGGPPKMYGANGSLRISVQNMTKLIRHIMGGMLKLDTCKIGQYVEADIAAHIKFKLMESVQKNGLSAAALRPDLLAAAMKTTLSSDFDLLGIWLEIFTVDSVEAMTPSVPGSGRE
jgi:hypothetical protein